VVLVNEEIAGGYGPGVTLVTHELLAGFALRNNIITSATTQHYQKNQEENKTH
jgi:hypothetical protein